MLNWNYISKLQSIFALISILTLFGGCYKYCESEAIYTKEEKDLIKSEISQKYNIDSLEVYLLQSRNEKNTFKEMLVCRYIGRFFRDNANFSNAINIHQTELLLAEQLNDTLEIVEALNDLGTDFRRIGALGEATIYHDRALKLTDLFSDQTSYISKKNKSVSLNGIGNISLTLKYNNDAMRCFKKALAIEADLNSPLGQAINYANLSAIFQSQKLYDSAIIYNQKSLEQNILAKSQIGISLCHNNFGSIYEEQGKLKEAREEYLKSYEEIKENKDLWHWLVACISLVRINLELENNAEAVVFLKKAHSVAIEINAAEYLVDIHLLLSKYYEKQGKYKQSLTQLQKSNEYEAKVQGKQEQNQFMETRLFYAREKNDREIQLLQETQKRQRREKRIITITGTIILLLCLFFLILLARFLRLQRKRNRELSEINATKDKFFSIISHDLKNPAIAQSNALQGLIDGIDTLDRDSLIQYYQNLLESAKSQTELLCNLLSWCQVQTGRMAYNPITFDLKSVIRSEVQLMQVLVDNKKIKLTVELPQNTIVYGDKIMVSIIIRNLLTNAIKFTNINGNINIKMEERKSDFIISIKDDGVGMNAERVKNIFSIDKQRTTRGTQGEGGSGLGLTVCKDLVIKHGGKITVTSEELAGTEFTFTLKKK